MGKKKKRSGGGACGGGGGGQQPKPAEEGEDKAVGDHADESSCEKAAADDKDKDKEKGKDKDKGKKAPPPFVTAVLKIDMHCDGCAKRIRGSVRHYPGVEGVAMEVDKGTMTVVGRFDAKKLRDRVAKKTKKKVDLVPNKDKDGGGGDGGKGKDDGEGGKKQGGFQVHEYGKPDYMYDYFWIDRVYGCAAKPPEKGHDHAKEDKKKDDHHKEDKGKDANKGCGGGGKGKDDKGGGGGDGGKGKDDKGGGGDKGKDDKSCGGEKGKGGKDNKKPVVPVVGTVVLKIGAMGLHCDGCMNRVRAKLFKIKGVEQVAMDLGKNQVTVTGTMDMKALPGKLQKKLRRPVDVVPAKDKDKEGKDKDKDGKQEGGCKDGGKEKEKDKGKDAATKALTAELELWKTAFYDQRSLLNTELMLSDENPNACSVM